MTRRIEDWDEPPPGYNYPSYGTCPGCKEELNRDRFCTACECFPHEIRLIADWKVRVRPNEDGSWSVAA